MPSSINPTLNHALDLDARDALAEFRQRFHFPKINGKDAVYLVGNSLGLQPKKTRDYVNEALDDWAELGVEGHFHAKNPWYSYHELVTEPMARIVGAKPLEVVVMNSLTVNLHLMMVSFYRPTSERFKIIMEGGAFPSDQYAIASHIRTKGFDPKAAIVELKPREGESTLRTEDILQTLATEGEQVALVLLGHVNYLSGQAFEIETITRAAKAKGCVMGLDLAHGAGNVVLKLHDWGVDFAVWCSYKYLNAGPGGAAACFVHERHAHRPELPRFAGWWGHNKTTRFQMSAAFEAMPGAEGWQISNPPILQLAALRASLEIFDATSITALRTKGDALCGYLEALLGEFPPGAITQLTSKDPTQRGTQLSFKVRGVGKALTERLSRNGFVCDFREPDVLRLAPVPLYTTFHDVFSFATALRTELGL